MTELDRLDLAGVGDDARAGIPAPGGSAGQLVAMDFALADMDASWGEGCDDDGGGGGGAASVPQPFDLVMTESGGTVQYGVAGGSFYFDGVQHYVSGLAGGISGTGEEAVYLVCTGTKVEPEEGEEGEEGEEPAYEWTFELATEEGSPSGSDEKVLNVKLYDLADGAVAMDYRGVNLPVCSGGVSAMRVNDLPSVYELVAEGVYGSRHFANRYYEVSGILREGPDYSVGADTTGFLALVVSGSSAAEVTLYGSFSALQGAMANQGQAVMPLYEFDSGVVKCDLRHVPRADMWSLGLSGGDQS